MADFYGTVQGFEDYITARGYEIPAVADDEDIAISLLVGSEWLDYRYISNWISSGTYKNGGRAQVREWPRSGYIDAYGYAVASDAVPFEIERATYEAALRNLNALGSLMKDYTPNKYTQASVEGAVSVTFADFGSAYDTQLQIPVIDGILTPLLGSVLTANVSSLSGATLRM